MITTRSRAYLALLTIAMILCGCGSDGGKPGDAANERRRADAGVDATDDVAIDDARGDTTGDTTAPDAIDGGDRDGTPACLTHHDCTQGDYCYQGSCVTDPLVKIFHLGKPGCPPGHWCVTSSGARDRCDKDPNFACNDACDCGPGHCCMDIAGVGKRCVRDLKDPWLPAPPGTSTIYNATCPVDAPTYCCSDASCHAGKAVYGAATGFACYDRASKTTQAICGGNSCQGTACHCAAGHSCVDTLSAGVPAGKACGQLTGGSCVSNAIAEAVFGWKANEILPCCTANCPTGQRCDRGFRTDGQYAFSRVEGVCGGICGNQTCDFGETPTSCPADCTVTLSGSPVCETVWKNPSMCGDGVCQGVGVCDWDQVESCATCPEDCGKCAWKMVHGQGGFTALTENLYGLWGSAPDNVFAVGEVGAILRWDGRRWTPMTSGTSKALYNVWGRSATDVYAVGRDGTMLHYDGTRWSAMTSGTTQSIYGIHGTASVLFAVGNKGLVMRHDGQSWTVGQSGNRALYNVWAASDGEAFAAGDAGRIVRYAAGQWQAMTSGTPRNLSGVWGTSPTNVYVVGTLGTALHYDGNGWTLLNTGLGAAMQTITGNSATDMTAIGLFGRVVHFDGTTWTETKVTSTTKFHGLWVAPGHTFVSAEGGALFYDSGSGFASTGATITDTLISVWRDATSGEAYAVGESGLVLHFDGTGWSSVSTPGSGFLTSVWGSSPSDVYAVGENGQIIHYDGTQWTSVASGTTEFLQKVWGSSKTDVFVVGPAGTMLHNDGSGFKPMTTGSSDFLHSVWGSSKTNVFAVGRTDLLRYDGTSWTRSALPSTGFHSVWGLSQSDVYTFEYSSGIRRFDGASFVSFYNPSDMRVYGLWGTSPTDLHAVGSNTSTVPYIVTMRSYDGTSWKDARADLREVGSLKCRALLDVKDGYAVGNNELILEHAP
ncbi:MAG: hypothetical protein KC503_46245 [Myxococcales bacterium]|nr:hypothetical protein [Myxococcales bacterium]